MSPLDRINAILSSPRADYLNGYIEYDEYRAMSEYDILDPDQKAAVDEMVRVCRETGYNATRNFPDLGAEVYAHKHTTGAISWGMNSLNDGCNFKRGIVE